jgi:hypothetical protein
MRRVLALIPVLALVVAALPAADDPKDTAKATVTRKKLKDKVTAEYKDELLKNVVDDLQGQVKNLFFMLDGAGGVSGNAKVTYKAKDERLDKVLEDICTKNGWGYFVINNKAHTRDGWIMIKVGDERGYEKGKEPTKDGDKDKSEPKDKAAAKDKAAKEKAKDKAASKDKDKAEPKDKDAKKKDEPKVEDDPDRAERTAALKVRSAKDLIGDGNTTRARELLKEVLKKWPDTKAAKDAKELLDELDK